MFCEPLDDKILQPAIDSSGPYTIPGNVHWRTDRILHPETRDAYQICPCCYPRQGAAVNPDRLGNFTSESASCRCLKYSEGLS